ncbi:uncharacterized protein LOC100209027 isoform X1 [Hydra vulgaris]|uniref:uncharacterized protein LOC100209027 isoform X1 n=1 Tax=Hydra vulgaris TaxID=6087 RepID=UPI000640CD3F|nr:trifunctional UDP-glucose 4,6-dehydratase/UDP-4-keto-6-deoxy-D-glucose 3,5-epimerase/UDP-4-keto-L-rhamnose-reductase RHM1 [Hydra vulgaris]
MGKTSNVLVLGGCGFIGRHLVTYLIKNNLAEKIRVADKSPPQLSWFNAEHKAVFEDPRVEFFQANLVNPAHVERVFATNGFLFDYVINLASETRYGQGDEVYTEHIYNLGVNVATKSASCKVKRYIELSTAQVYESDKKASDEEGKLNPWTSLAIFKLKLEKKLREIEGLDYVIIRPALVYGISDKHSLTPRLIIGAVYKQLQEKMKLLWSKDLKMNTVHVNDVAIAIWFLCTHGKKGDVYNLVDKQDSTQGSISELVCQIFGIKYDFFGSVISNVAKLNMNGVVDESNEKHLAPWSVACTADKIVNTPLSPYLDKEILYNNHLHIEGTKIESLGFKYTKPHVTAEDLKLVVQDYVTLGIFPPSLVG